MLNKWSDEASADGTERRRRRQRPCFGDDLKKETVFAWDGNALVRLWIAGGTKKRGWDETIFQSEPFGQHIRDERDSKEKQNEWRREGGRMRLDWNPSDESNDMATMALNPPSVASPKEDRHVMYAWPRKPPLNVFVPPQRPHNHPPTPPPPQRWSSSCVVS